MIKMIILVLSALCLARTQDTCWAPSLYYGSRCVSSKSLYVTENTYIDYYFESLTPGIGAYCYAMAMAPYMPGATCRMEWQYVGYINPQG